MIRVRRSEKRGELVREGVRARHSFSFGAYRDEDWPAPGLLKAINEKEYGPGAGIPAQSHRNVEILTYVMEGCLSQMDLAGEETRLRAGELGVTHAGSGIRQEEWNASAGPLRFVQLWLARPGNANKPPCRRAKNLQWVKPGELSKITDARQEFGDALTVCFLRSEEGGTKQLKNIYGKFVWIQVVKGDLRVGRQRLVAGDGAEVSGVRELSFSWDTATELLVVEQSS